MQRGRNMTEAEYQQWWQLHIRTARGELLNETDQKSYRAGVDKLDREEAANVQFGALANLRQLRQQVQLLTQNLAQLTAQNELLAQRIAVLEQTYQQLTGYALLVDTHASS